MGGGGAGKTKKSTAWEGTHTHKKGLGVWKVLRESQKTGIGEERGRMREEEESSGSGQKWGQKKARRCGGLFSWWHWALTDACCSALVRSLLSCQPDYYQGLAAGRNNTHSTFPFVTLARTHADTHTLRGHWWRFFFFFSQSHCSFRAYGHLLALARRLNKSSFTLSISLPLLSERVFARQQSV